jgi:hypothetical protein
MPMALKEEIRLLSMVDILGPLSEEEMEDLAKRTPDTFLEQDDILYTPRRARSGYSSSRRAGSNSTRWTKAGMRSPSLLWRTATSSGRWP